MMSRTVHPGFIRPLLIALIAVLAVTIAGIAIASSTGWTRAEVNLLITLDSPRNPELTVIAHTLATLFGAAGAGVVAVLVMTAVGFRHRSLHAVLAAAVVIAAPWGVTEVVKLIVHRARPALPDGVAAAAATPGDFSFPSGHTAFACSIACALVLVLASGRARWITAGFGVVLVAAVAWSRLYLGVHHLSDVLASMVLVIPVAVACERIMRRGLARASALPASVEAPLPHTRAEAHTHR